MSEKYKPSLEEIEKAEDITVEKEITPEKVDYSQILDRVREMGQNLIKQAEEVNIMIKMAKEKGLELDDETKKELEKWSAPNGEYENQLVVSSAKIGLIKGDLYSKGIMVTQEELDQSKQ